MRPKKKVRFQIKNPEELLGIYAIIVFLLLLSLSLFLGFATASVPVAAGASAVMVYTRNSVTVLLWMSLALFFKKWSDSHNSVKSINFNMKKFKILILIVAILGTMKTILAIVNLTLYLGQNYPLIVAYYIGEAVAWGAMTIFFYFYYRLRRSNKE